MKSQRIQNKIIGLCAVVFVTSALAVIPTAVVHAARVSELQIDANGAFSAKNVVVMQKSGTSNFFARVTWPNVFVRVTVLAHGDTLVTKEHGEVATSDIIKEGDTLDVEGALSSGEGSFVVNATKIVDHALLQQSQTLSGTVLSVNTNTSSFLLSNKTFGSTTIIVPGGVSIQKGARTIGVGDLQKGDKILSVAGTYDYASNTLTASSLSAYQDASIFVARNFEGTIKSVSGTTLPANITVAVGQTIYTVYLPAGAPVMKANRAATNLARYQVGDTVRFFGSVRKIDLSAIDADAVRDINF